MIWLLDTTVLIDCNRGKTQATDWLSAHFQDCAISVITLAELLQGVRAKAERAAIDHYCSAMPVLPVTHEVAIRAGEWAASYSKSHGCGLSDCLIAASADLEGLKLATHNLKHFPMFEGLRPPY